MVHIIDYKSYDVIVVYCFLRSANSLNLAKRSFDFLFCERLETKFAKMIGKGMTARVFAQYEVCFFSPYGLRSHDFIGLGLLIIPCW